jgi:hypothetical protein
MNEERFIDPQVVTVGALGQPGARLFMIQVREGVRLRTIKAEKSQIAALAAYLGQLVKELPRPGHLPDLPELESESTPDLAAGDLGVEVVGDAIELRIEALEDLGEFGSISITMQSDQAAAFAIKAVRLVEQGRPPCPLCALPLDPRGHDCPRTNGYRAPIT